MDKLFEKIIASGIAVAIITFLGYLLAFVYTMSYLNYFGIPTTFVTVDTNTVISFIAPLLAVLGMSLLFTAGVLGMIPYEKKGHFKPSLDALAIGISTCTLGYALQIFQTLSLLPAILFGGSILFAFVFQTIQLYKKYPQYKGFRAKCNAAKSRSEAPPSSPKDREAAPNYFSLVPKPVAAIFTLLALLVFLYSISAGQGTYMAKTQRTFLQSDSFKDYLLISVSGDTAVFVQHNGAEFCRQYMVVPRNSLGALHEITIPANK